MAHSAILSAAMVFTCGALALAPQLAADTIHVPADVATVQGAVDLAASGDTILVAPGVYVENVVIVEKIVTLRSSAGAEETTLLASGGTGVRVQGTHVGPIIIDGFTITGGTGSVVPGVSGLPETVGGGVVVNMRQTNPFDPAPATVITRCVIRNNRAPDAGGGVYAVSPVDISDCIVEHNTTQGDGGGLLIAGSTADSFLTNTIVRNNVAAGCGGGYAALGTRVGVSDSQVLDNAALCDGGGGYVLTGSAWVGVEGVHYEGNHAGGDGGGLAATRNSGITCCAITLSDLVLIDNVAEGNGGGLMLQSDVGLGAFANNLAVVERLLAVDNEAGGEGGAIWSRITTEPGIAVIEVERLEVQNATLVGNRASSIGDGVQVAAKEAVFVNSVMWDAGNDPFGGVAPVVSWSQVEGGWPGVGNDASDPLFLDESRGDYGLRGGSPCIDSGDPASEIDVDGSRADRGALAFEGWVDVGAGLGGNSGTPRVIGEGLNSPSAFTTLTLTDAAPFAPVVFVTGFADVSLPFKGGSLVPSPDFFVFGFQADAAGALELTGEWSPSLPSDNTSWLQLWMIDATGPAGWTASNGLRARTR